MATEKIFEALIGIRAEGAQLRADLERAKSELRGGLLSMQSITKQLAPIISAAGVTAFVKSIVDARIAVERIQNTLKVVAGGSEGAAAEFGFIRDEAKRLGLDLETTASQYAKLAASSKGTTLQGEETRRIFVAVSEAAAVLGLSADEAGGALQAIQQIISKGKVQAEELRGQLGERLPGAFQIAARALGVTTQELDKMLETGQITADQLLPKLATELRKTFGSGVADAANSTQASINRLRTTYQELLVTLGNSGIIDLLRKSMEGWSVIISGVRVEFERLASTFGYFQDRVTKDRVANIDDTVRALRESFDQLSKQQASPTVEAALRKNVEERRKLLEERSRLDEQLKPKANLIQRDPNVRKTPPTTTKSKADNQADDFIGSLEKQADALRQTQVELTQGATAAKAYGLELEFAAFKQKLIQDGKPIPAGLDADFQRVKTLIIELTGESDRLKTSLEQSFSARRFAEEEEEFAAIAAEQKRNLDELNRATEEGIRLRAAVPANLQQQLVRNIEAQLAKEKEEAAFLETVYGPSFERAAADVEALKKAIEALKATGIGGDNASALQIKAELDRRSLDRGVEELRRSEILLNVQAQLGFNIDTLGPQIELLRRQIQERISQIGNQRDAVLDPTVRALGGQLKDTIVTKEFTDLRREIDLAGKQAQVFGSEFDSVGVAMDATRRAIENLLREGLDPLDPRIESLRTQLGELSQLDFLGRTADSIGDNFADALDGVFDEGVEFGDKMKNLFKNIAKDISREFAREAGRELSGALRGLLFGQSGGVGGAAGGIGGGILGPLLQQFSSQIGSYISSLFSSSASSFASSVDAGSFFNIAHQGGFVADDGTIKRFATGGMVNGAGEVPAILHTGEFVLRKAIVDAIGVDTLQRLNKGSFQAFEMGGLVMQSNAIRSTRPADLRPQTTDGERGGRRSPEVHVEVNGSIIKNPNIPDEQVIRVWAKDYRGWGVTRAIVKGDR